MSSSRKLSTDEVDALMEGLQSGVISTEGNISPEAEVRPFVFGSDDLSLLGCLLYTSPSPRDRG